MHICSLLWDIYSLMSQSNEPYPNQSQYVATVRSAGSQWFARHGFRTSAKHSHVLCEHSQWPQNIVLPAVAATLQSMQAAKKGVEWFPLHKDLHNGSSSQAMLFNLVGPLLVRNDYAPLHAAFAAGGAPWPGGSVHLRFEFSDPGIFQEDKGQPTSFDLAIFGDTGTPIFVEAKLTEAVFGGCSIFAKHQCDGHNPLGNLPSCYLHQTGHTYWDHAIDCGLATSPLAAAADCPFKKHYQFFRESLFALAKGGHFVLLYDARSPVFVRPGHEGAAHGGLWTFLFNQAPPPMRSRLHAVTIQQVVKEIEQSGRHRDWIGVFKEKYGLE